MAKEKYDIRIKQIDDISNCSNCGEYGELFEVTLSRGDKGKTYRLCKKCAMSAQRTVEKKNQETYDSDTYKAKISNDKEQKSIYKSISSASDDIKSQPQIIPKGSVRYKKWIVLSIVFIISLSVIIPIAVSVHNNRNSTTNNYYNNVKSDNTKSNESPSDVVKIYFDAVKYGDTDKAISCFTPDIQAQWKAVLSLSGFFTSKAVGFGDASSLLGGLIATANTSTYSNYKFKVTNEKITDNENAVVEVSIYIDDSFDSTTEINLVKVYDKWYITENAPTKESLELTYGSGFNKDDGPILYTGDENNFELIQYIVKTGEFKSVFKYDRQNKYQLLQYIDRTDINGYYHGNSYKTAQMFSSDLSKLAIQWYTNDDGKHVGYIDSEGNVTDVSIMIHQSGTGFSGTTLDDDNALFTSDDLFFFRDNNENKFIYFDLKNKEIVREVEIDEKSRIRYYCLTHEDDPTEEDYFVFNSSNVKIEYGDDYIITQDAMIGLYTTRHPNGIIAWGPDVSFSSGNAKTYYYKNSDDNPTVTPETEFRIQSVATYDNTVYFDGSKNNKKYLFSMEYSNGGFSEPKQLAEIPSGYALCFCKK